MIARAPASVLARIALLASAGVACGGETSLPPHGEALVIVDTDLPVPKLASRLRVDLFAEDGTWIESRDIGRSDPRDWPASFSVYSDDDAREKRVLVRLRAYADGASRDYRGERFAPRPEYKEPAVAKDLASLCANAPELPIGGRVTLRRGATPITEVVEQKSCAPPTKSGSVAARVTVTTKGRYRFSVADSVPFETRSALLLRSRCDDPASQLFCNATAPDAPPVSTGHFPRFDATLDPGTYFLLTAGAIANWPADLTLEAVSLDAPLPEAPPAPRATPPNGPRLLRVPNGEAQDVTPATEPVPSATVDRLLLVVLKPGARGRVQVVLRGACAGTMAKLGADPQSPDLANASTCVDQENVRVPVAPVGLEEDMSRPTASVQGSFTVAEPCDPSATSGAVACIPGGTFLLGSQTQPPDDPTGLSSAAPARIAIMPRFWLDRYEVTVARLRDAVGRGLAIDPTLVQVNDAPIDLEATTMESYCSYSTNPMGREDFAVTCIAWPLARAFCRMEGGDLPTEAQWEYAARWAGRSFPSRYAWGNDDATCDRVAFGRLPRRFGAFSACSVYSDDKPVSVGPLAVTAFDGREGRPGDVTPLGVVNMSGGVSEWTLDAAQSYASPCWASAPLRAPSCVQENAALHVVRGGEWSGRAQTATERFPVLAASGPFGIPFMPAYPQVGFRCAYTARPPR